MDKKLDKNLKIEEAQKQISTLSVDDSVEYEYEVTSIRNNVSMHSENDQGEMLDQIRLSITDYSIIVLSVDLTNVNFEESAVGVYLKLRKTTANASGGIYYIQDDMGTFSASLIDEDPNYFLIPLRELVSILGSTYINIKLIPGYDVSATVRSNYAMMETKKLVDHSAITSIGYQPLICNEDEYFQRTDLSVNGNLSDGRTINLASSDYLFLENPEDNINVGNLCHYSDEILKTSTVEVDYNYRSQGLPIANTSNAKSAGKIAESKREFEIVGGKVEMIIKSKELLYEFCTVTPENSLTKFGISHIINRKNTPESRFGKFANLNIAENLLLVNNQYFYQTAKGEVYDFKTVYYELNSKCEKIYKNTPTANSIEEKITINGWTFTNIVPEIVKSSDLYDELNSCEDSQRSYKCPVSWLYNNSYVKGYNKNGNLVMISDYNKNTMLISYNNFPRIETVCEYYNGTKLGEYQFLYTNGFLYSIVDIMKNVRTNFTFDSSNRLVQIAKTNDVTLNFTYANNDNINSVTSSDGYKTTITLDDTNYNCNITNYSTVSDKESEEGQEKILNKSTITERELTTTITDENGDCEHIVCDNDGNEVERYVIENGLVSSAEMYKYIAYTSNETTKAKQESLFKTNFQNFVFERGEITTETLNKRNLVFRRKIENTPVTPTTHITVEISFTYDQKDRCVKETEYTRYYTDGNETPFDSFTKVTEYTYNDKNQVLTKTSYISGEETTNGITVEETEYNEQGCAIKNISYNSLENSKFITEKTYNTLGQVVSEKDETGEYTTTHAYNNKRLLSKTYQPNGNVTNFNYDTRERLNKISSTVNSTENANNIIYVRDSINETKASNDSSIKYEYELKRRTSKITVDGNVYQTFEYQDDVEENGKTVDKTFKTNAKGETVSVVEAKDGSFTEISYNGELQVKQTFNSDGTVSSVEDNVTGEKFEYVYDSLGNVTQISKTVNDVLDRTETVIYDNYGNVSQKSVTGGNTENYTYKDNAERDLESITHSKWLKSAPKTDVLKRNTGKTVTDGENTVYDSSITYLTNEIDGVIYATGKPQTVTFNGETLSYEYDELGNIYQIKKNGEVLSRYLYDGNNRLIREDNRELNKSNAFSYDANGNLLSNKQVAFTLEEISNWSNEKVYTYAKDKLIAFDGKNFVYDSVGNPTTYKDIALTWEKGKRLVSYGVNTFAYNGEGRRIRKNTTAYTYDGENRLVSTSDGLQFYYDQDGIAGFTYQNAKYVYQKDAQNNIVGIVDSTGAVVVKYTYDAWGNHTVNGSLATTVGMVNPFRYRSYFYDVETGLYYLKTRYYDPETCRFINMDSIEYADHETVNGLNLFAYCNNNPVMGYDPNGTWNWKKFFTGLAIVAVAAVVITATVVSLPSTSIVGQGIISGTISATCDMLTQTIKEGKDLSEVDYLSVGKSFASGVICGVASSFGIEYNAIASFATTTVSSLTSGENIITSLFEGVKSAGVSLASSLVTRSIGKIKVGKISKQNYQTKKGFLKKSSNRKLHSYSPQINKTQGFKGFIENALTKKERFDFYSECAGRGVGIAVDAVTSLVSGWF